LESTNERSVLENRPRSADAPARAARETNGWKIEDANQARKVKAQVKNRL